MSSLRLAGPFNSGVATANTTSPIRLNGKVHGIYVKYNDSPPGATTDVVIKTLGTSPSAPTYNLVTLTDQATAKWVYPRVLVQDTAGADIAGEYTHQLIDDFINVKIDQANAADNVDVWLLLE